MRRKRLKITCPPTFTGWSTQRNAMFSGVFSCWRWENAFLSAIHRIQIFQCIFKLLPSDYHAENGIYSYIHRRFTPLTTWKSIDMFIIHTCFGKALFSLMKKKTKKKNNNNKKSHIVSPEYAGLNQTNYSVQTFECSCLLLQRIVYDQMEEKLSNK